MSNSALDNFFKQELDDAGFEYQESLWQQLDKQLQPVRHQQPKRRRVAVWILLFLAAGGAAWFVAEQSKSKPDLAQNKPAETSAPQISPTTAPAPITTTPDNKGTTTPANNAVAGSRQQDNTVTSPGVTTYYTAEPGVSKHRRTGRKRVSSRNPQPAIIPTGPAAVLTVTDNEEPADKEVTVMMDEGKAIVEPAPAPTVAKPARQQPATAQPPVTTDKTTAKKQPTKPASSKLGYHFTLGTNWSSPFSKPGVFAGVMLTKTIGDKHLFAGLKITGNHLEHQFTSAGKVNQTPVVTDAIIEKLTLLQIPFGYEFRLNGKQATKAPSFLQVGFEPSFVTGLRTVFYDDNGIPGGPVTPVRNSPLLSNAINKFNVSFIAGLRKQFNSRLGVSLSAGYNLIDITDKQYYNRTTRNNNLRYLQAGLQWRINK